MSNNRRNRKAEYIENRNKLRKGVPLICEINIMGGKDSRDNAVEELKKWLEGNRKVIQETWKASFTPMDYELRHYKEYDFWRLKVYYLMNGSPTTKMKMASDKIKAKKKVIMSVSKPLSTQ